jgi:hypothetical protein
MTDTAKITCHFYHAEQKEKNKTKQKGKECMLTHIQWEEQGKVGNSAQRTT